MAVRTASSTPTRSPEDERALEEAVLVAMRADLARHPANRRYSTPAIAGLVRWETGLGPGTDRVRAACERLARRGVLERRSALSVSGTVLWAIVA